MSEKNVHAYLQSDQSGPLLDRTLLRWFWPFAQPWSVWIVAVFITLLACESIPFLFPTLLERIIDGPVAQKNLSGIVPWIALYFGLVVFHAALVLVKTYLSQKIGIAVIHSLRVQLFRHLQTLDMVFFQRTPAGRLITRMTHDVDTLQMLLSEGLIDLASAVLMLLFAMGVMLYKDWRLALATLVLMPALMGVTALFRRSMRAINVQIRLEIASLNSSLQENLNGMPLVQLFRKQAQRLALFSERSLAYNQTTHRQAKVYSWFFPAINTLSEFSLLICYTAGIWLIGHDEITAGTLAAFAWLASIFNRPLREISDRITNLQTALAAGERVFTLAQSQPQIPSGTESLPAGPLDIEFQQVSFSYREDQTILHDITFKVKAGTTTALVGSTGSGKSTITHLVNRFYLPTSGTVRIGGQNVAKLDATNLHRRIATVSQDVFLFAGTLRDNVLLGEAFEAQRFINTCARTQLDQIAKRLPLGYDTVLREGGKGLSTGERQLVSFARALYAEPEILLLDEATASIDTSTEQLVQQALREVTRGRTSLVVAHRLSTIADAEQILVIQEGRIVERGTHADLLAQEGHYKRLLG